MVTNNDEICEGLYNTDSWDLFDCHLGSYVISLLQLRYVSSKTSILGRALRHGIVDLLDHITKNINQHIENNTTTIGTEHRLYHSRNYTLNIQEDNIPYSIINNNDNKFNIEISSLAPTVFYQLRENIGISNENFRQSFFQNNLKDFTNPGKSGSLMYKTYDDLFILKTLRDYEARLLIQILSGYHLQLTQRVTIFNRYIGLYCIRLQGSVSTINIFIVIMLNTFTPSLKINEIYDLKGSKINRNSMGTLSLEKFYHLKDMDFRDLYPFGIRIPTNIYSKLKIIIDNNTKVLKKLNIIDYSLILGIRHLDMSEDEMIYRLPTGGISALLHLNDRLGLMSMEKFLPNIQSSNLTNNLTSLSYSYLKPLEMIQEKIDMNLYYNNDSIAHATLPIPGIINKTNQRVYIYLTLIDMLQTFDSCKLLDHTFRKLTNHSKHLEYSVIDPEAYAKRMNQFLFEHVFIDAKDDFPWTITSVSKPVADLNNKSMKKKKSNQQTTSLPTRRHSLDRQISNTIVEFRL
ncbi:unnamed protein product [Rotaria sordida]|uniref:PIPK domain-containing protein n=1 Tax=Rotaria sordida TaxID=392033 RepID=A0A814RB11_9BILA|nr:unnamed protein product [Rotaria sordida]CAF1019699.1 unnamed protein product [Rotaria sordida]CAF1131060.1 unnamed protein product [Rotaria sordida]CAF3996549.1 unnamed protein product [Rotaria sordida]